MDGIVKNDGSGFENEIKKSLEKFAEKHEKFFWYRIPDFHSWIVLNPKLIHPKCPSDFFSIYEGVPIFLEVKSTRSPSRFTLFHLSHGEIESTLKNHQRQYGLDITDAGGRYFVLINKRIPHQNHVFVMDVRDFVKMEQFVAEGKTKNNRSITWSEIEDLLERKICFELKLKKSKIWDLELIYQQI